ncbi:hypothetical protein [Streptomyces sp. NPDC018833]
MTIAEATNDMHVRLDPYGHMPEVQEPRQRAEAVLPAQHQDKTLF